MAGASRPRPRLRVKRSSDHCASAPLLSYLLHARASGTHQLDRLLVLSTQDKKARQKHGFIITVCQQAPQSPDLNIEDIAFFNSLQSDTSCVATSNLFELRDAVNKCYEEYPTERLEACWRVLNINLRGILESEGDNDYKTHVGDRKRATKGLAEDRKVPAELIKKARRAFKKMYAQWNKENPDKDIDDASEPESSESEDV